MSDMQDSIWVLLCVCVCVWIMPK